MKTSFRLFTLGLAMTAAAVTGWGANAFTENMGTPTGTTAIASNTFQNSSTAGITFAGTAEVRITSMSNGYLGVSGGGNIYFAAATAAPRIFTISGIDLSAAATRNLSFGVWHSAAATNTDFVIQYSTDGSNWTNVSYAAIPTGNSTWGLRAADAQLPQVAGLTLRFTNNSTGSQFRLDDIIIGDIPTPPAPINGTCASVKASANGTRFQNVRGIVTSVGGAYGRLQFTIQDATGGLLIDKGSATYTQPALGDDVTIGVAGKTVASGTIELQPEGSDAAAFTINSSGNALPAPVTYDSVSAFLAADNATVQGLRVQICNVYLKTATVAAGKAGDTTWLEASATAGALGFVFTDDAADFTAYLTNDLHGKLTDWQAKTRPVVGDTNDRVNIIAVGAQYSGVNQVSLNDPVGTAAKTDEAGPIAPAKKAAVNEWALY